MNIEKKDTESVHKQFVTYYPAIDAVPTKKEKIFFLKNGDTYKHRRLVWDSANGTYGKRK